MMLSSDHGLSDEEKEAFGEIAEIVYDQDETSTLDEEEEEFAALATHWACKTKRTQPGVVQFLAHRLPMAASRRTLDGLYPIYLLFKREHTLEEVKAVVQADSPAGSLSKQEHLLLQGFASRHGNVQVIEYIVEQCPLVRKKHETVRDISLPHFTALAKLLPQLTKFSLHIFSRELPTSNDLIGWNHVMETLGNCNSLDSLNITLKFPEGFPSTGLDALGNALASIENLKSLTLDGGERGHWNRTILAQANLTAALVTLLSRNSLQAIRVPNTISVDHNEIFDALKRNISLETFDIVSCVNNDDKRKALAQVLQVNTTLRFVELRSTGGEAVTYDKIRYLLQLNMSGRAKARTCTTSREEFVDLLATEVESWEISSTSTSMQTSLMLDLLRECPSIWCRRPQHR
ncbi:expressed unknown protein [Seminavis robusta]|uniref:Uncharacterized protein n=1 Tax=Seminavis robusta TaxID=568900 RepID=A0A9N8F3Z2_9STRA|nr:expressed unknown protein [Seminavis robusta]|eukprot:Sro2759_g336390.1 n/a (404) ;mRNA; r:3088-4469